MESFTRYRTNFARRFVTMKETSYHYDPDLRQQTSEWTEHGCYTL